MSFNMYMFNTMIIYLAHFREQVIFQNLCLLIVYLIKLMDTYCELSLGEGNNGWWIPEPLFFQLQGGKYNTSVHIRESTGGIKGVCQ